MPAVSSRARIGDSRLAARLARETQGEVLFSAGDRGRYATDASIYQMEPVGVLVPRTAEDVAAAMAICREEGVPVLPRGGGTSQCGQTVNRALVLDCTKHLRRVIAVEGDTARVEPGATVVVIGCGGVGQAVIQGARIAGAARIVAVDPVALKRESALALGATDVVDPSDVKAKDAVREITDGRGADYAFEVIGTAATMRQAVECTRPGGTTVMVGMPELGSDVAIPASIVE